MFIISYNNNSRSSRGLAGEVFIEWAKNWKQAEDEIDLAGLTAHGTI